MHDDLVVRVLARELGRAIAAADRFDEDLRPLDGESEAPRFVGELAQVPFEAPDATIGVGLGAGREQGLDGGAQPLSRERELGRREVRPLDDVPRSGIRSLAEPAVGIASQ